MPSCGVTGTATTRSVTCGSSAQTWRWSGSCGAVVRCAPRSSPTRGRTDRVLKVTLPSPSLFANFWDPERAPADYRSVEDFLADVAELLREEADELEAMGATYLQLDAPHYTMVLDPRYRNFYTGRGWPTEPWIELGLELDNRVIGDRQGVTALGGFRAVAAGAHRPVGCPRPGDDQAVRSRVRRRPGEKDRGGEPIRSARSARGLTAVRVRHLGARQRAHDRRRAGKARPRRRRGPKGVGLKTPDRSRGGRLGTDRVRTDRPPPLTSGRSGR